MDAKEKLKAYRHIILQMSGHLASGHLKMSSGRALDTINFKRLVVDAKAAKEGIEREEIGLGVHNTKQEQADLEKQVAEYKGVFRKEEG